MKIGQTVNFEFRTHPIMGGNIRRGVGVIHSDTVVGSSDAKVVEITEVGDYQIGEFVHVRTSKIQVQ